MDHGRRVRRETMANEARRDPGSPARMIVELASLRSALPNPQVAEPCVKREGRIPRKTSEPRPAAKTAQPHRANFSLAATGRQLGNRLSAAASPRSSFDIWIGYAGGCDGRPKARKSRLASRNELIPRTRPAVISKTCSAHG
jgi:hypothetical protein